jgi:hypothetical protein
MAVKRSDFTRTGPGVYKGPDGKTYNIGSGTLDALVNKLNKAGGAKDKKAKSKSAITAQDRATGVEFEQKFKDTVQAPATIADPFADEIANLVRSGGSNIAPTGQETTALNNLQNLVNTGGPSDPLEAESNNYLAELMRQGMSQEQKDAALSLGSSTINRNLQGVLRSALGGAASQGLNPGSAISNSLGNINEAGGLLQQLSRQLVLDDLQRRDKASVDLGSQLNSQLTRRGNISGQAAGNFAQTALGANTNRINMFNQMINGLVGQQANNLNLQSTNIANTGSFQLGQYGAYMGGMSTSAAQAEAERVRKLQEKQIAMTGSASRAFGGGAYQPGVNSSPSFPDPGSGTPGASGTQGKSAGGF